MKQCSTCKAFKPFEAFYKNARTLDGYVYQCKKCQIAYTKNWIKNNPEKRAAAQRSYNQKNPYKVKKWGVTWRTKHLQKLRARHALYYAKHAGAIKAKQSLYRHNHPEVMAVARHRYRALKRNAQGSHTASDLKFLFVAQQGKCAMCHASFAQVKCHIDHIMPLALGGSNDKSNLQLLCATCNKRKSKKHPITFAQQMGFLL